jgi:hypothetical protein
MQKGQAGIPVIALADHNWEHVHPDHPLELVIERLKRNPGILPVLSRSHVRRLEGIITPDSLLTFLQTAWSPNGQEVAGMHDDLPQPGSPGLTQLGKKGERPPGGNAKSWSA